MSSKLLSALTILVWYLQKLFQTNHESYSSTHYGRFRPLFYMNYRFICFLSTGTYCSVIILKSYKPVNRYFSSHSNSRTITSLLIISNNIMILLVVMPLLKHISGRTTEMATWIKWYWIFQLCIFMFWLLYYWYFIAPSSHSYNPRFLWQLSWENWVRSLSRDIHCHSQGGQIGRVVTGCACGVKARVNHRVRHHNLCRPRIGISRRMSELSCGSFTSPSS